MVPAVICPVTRTLVDCRPEVRRGLAPGV